MSRLSLALLVVLIAGVAYAQTPRPADSNDPADDTGTRSVDGTGIRSVDGTGIQSVDGTGIQSVDGTGIQSESTGQRYTVKAGDTLGKIAHQFYGDSSQWQLIYDANTGVLSDADVIPVGVVLTIPASE